MIGIAIIIFIVAFFLIKPFRTLIFWIIAWTWRLIHPKSLISFCVYTSERTVEIIEEKIKRLEFDVKETKDEYLKIKYELQLTNWENQLVRAKIQLKTIKNE